MKKDIISIFGNGIEITKQDEGVVSSHSGIMIRYEDKPIISEVIGYAYLIVDCSSSMGDGNKVNQAKDGALKFARGAKVKGYLIGLVKFDTFAELLCVPREDISILRSHLSSLSSGGFTNMAMGIYLAVKDLEHREGFRAMVIVTDGMPQDREGTLLEAQQAKRKGIRIITIGTDDADRDFLRELASEAGLGIKIQRVQLKETVASASRLLLDREGLK